MSTTTGSGWTLSDELRLNEHLRGRLRMEIARAKAASSQAEALVDQAEQTLVTSHRPCAVGAGVAARTPRPLRLFPPR